MPAGRYNFTIEQGASHRIKFIARDKRTNELLDLTGYSARMQARQSVGSPTALLDLDTGSKGGLEIDGPDAEVVLDLTEAQTAAISVPEMVYDIELVAPDGWVMRFMKGKIKVDFEVTRD